jgi:hypothetical protein
MAWLPVAVAAPFQEPSPVPAAAAAEQKELQRQQRQQQQLVRHGHQPRWVNEMLAFCVASLALRLPLAAAAAVAAAVPCPAAACLLACRLPAVSAPLLPLHQLHQTLKTRLSCACCCPVLLLLLPLLLLLCQSQQGCCQSHHQNQSYQQQRLRCHLQLNQTQIHQLASLLLLLGPYPAVAADPPLPLQNLEAAAPLLLSSPDQQASQGHSLGASSHLHLPVPRHCRHQQRTPDWQGLRQQPCCCWHQHPTWAGLQQQVLLLDFACLLLLHLAGPMRNLQR